MSRDFPQLKLRLPEDIKARIADAASLNGRSVNAEIVARLRSSEVSLRDHFAASIDGLSEDASPAYCENLVGRPLPDGFGRDAMQWWAEADAAFRYLKADAMLAERAKGGDA